MDNNYSTEALIKSLKTNAFILNSSMPMGYVPGLPIICVLNGNLCLKVPFLKYKITGEVDKTLVYPIKYMATVLLPQGVVVSFEDLSLRNVFSNVAFNRPIGTFRHAAIKDLDKKTYSQFRSQLYDEYDKIILHMVSEQQCLNENNRDFKRLFNIILEPSLRPFYHAIDSSFFNEFITNKGVSNSNM